MKPFLKIFGYTFAVTLTILLLLGYGQAKADSFTCRSVQWYGTTCTRNVPAPAPQPMTRAEIEAQDAKIAKWEDFCKPTKTYDKDGIGRLSYAQPGCEFGRDQ